MPETITQPQIELAVQENPGRDELQQLLDAVGFTVPNCPMVRLHVSCVHGCSGGWPGTNMTEEKLTRAVGNEAIRRATGDPRAFTFNPERLGCGPLAGNAEHGLQEAAVIFERAG